jgi:hypothetical protein
MSLIEKSDELESSTAMVIRNYGENQSLAVSLARAEVDQQVATARALPRMISRVVANIKTLATLDEQACEECIYALPRGGKPIKGPSIRLAEIVASQWGNCRVAARVVHVDRLEKFVEAEGVFHDLETNTATTARVRRRLSDKQGRLFNDDMIGVTSNAACAIAKRNAILGGVPKAAWRQAYDAVESVLAGDLKTLAERRQLALKTFAAFGVTPERIFKALGVAAIDDVTLEHMGTLTAMRATLKNGEASVEEMFPVEPALPPPGARKPIAAKLDELATKPRLGEEEVQPKAADNRFYRQKEETRVDPDTGEIVYDFAAETKEGVGDFLEIKEGSAPPIYGTMEAVVTPDKMAQPADTLLLTARNIASFGSNKLTVYLQKLSDKNYTKLEPDMDDLRAIAAQADGEHNV